MDKKQILKEAAYGIFSKKGYKDTGISEIADSAGIAVGSFYNYYQSKEAIFLDTYIDENNRVRQIMMDELDWSGDMVKLIGQIFTRSRSLISSSKILSEWYNPAISDELHKYYASEKGKNTNPFHQFLIKTFTSRMVKEGFSKKQIRDILRVYNLFYYMDIHITEDDFPDISQTFEILVTNFIKGVLR